MNIKKLSVSAAAIAIAAGIGVGAFFATRPAKAEMNAEEEIIEYENKNEITSEVEESVTTEPEVTYKLTDEGEIILPKGSEMNPENAILVPKEEWEGLGLLDPSKYEAIPGGMGEIRYVEKWNVETGDGEFKTYFCVLH